MVNDHSIFLRGTVRPKSFLVCCKRKLLHYKATSISFYIDSLKWQLLRSLSIYSSSLFLSALTSENFNIKFEKNYFFMVFKIAAMAFAAFPLCEIAFFSSAEISAIVFLYSGR